MKESANSQTSFLLVNVSSINKNENSINQLLSSNLVALQVLHIAEAHELSYVVMGLKPYGMYNFTVTLCNQIGCVTSEPAMGQTLAAGKETVCIKVQSSHAVY